MFTKVTDFMTSYPKLRWHNVHKFSAKVELSFETANYQLKTVTTQKELIEAFALRFDIFHREMIGKNKAKGLDIDEFDVACDHLIIIDKSTKKIVGTYRLNCSLYNDEFYSAREFDLKALLAQPFVKLELGRACIHKDHRHGAVISLLFKGIAEYMTRVNAHVLFGCTSVLVKSPYEASLLHRYFAQNNRVHPQWETKPTADYKMFGLELWTKYFFVPLSEAENKEAKKLLPPLFRAYLKFGAFVGGEPAWDSEFKCIDFLTILPREALNEALWKKYNLTSEVQ